MKVIRIEGVKTDGEIIQNSLEAFLPCYPVFIINEDKILFKFIEELELDDNLLFRLKIAKELDFDGVSVVLKDKYTDETIVHNISSFSDLIEEIDDFTIEKYSLIIDTKDNELISEITQALIYLNIKLEVIMKKEKGCWTILDTFRRQYDEIKNSVVNVEKELKDLSVDEELLNNKNGFTDIFNEIETELEKACDRSLNISVMATKKAGKSVVVNSFLKEQYAPTSLELPTPNTCIYKKSRDGNNRLSYGGSHIIFNNPGEMYKYIFSEFKKAQNDKEHGYTIEDMEIYYTNSNNSFTNFTVIDTPGSNYALANDSEKGENFHKKIVDKWIDKSDVVLFLVNYSTYLSVDEEAFFNSIKSEFEKHNKFYSLVVVVNKLDEMIISECENKSVIRFLDYIRNKLKDMGYKDFVVMGTSARSYFDIIKVCKIDSSIGSSLEKVIPIENLKGYQLRERMKSLKKKYIGKNEMNALSFVDDQLEKLECFYGLQDYDLNTLRERSGMVSLIDYVTYISMQKAHIEAYGPIISNIDEKYSKIKNRVTVNNLVTIKKDKQDEFKDIENMLKDIIFNFEAVQKEMEEKITMQKFKANVLNTVQISEDKWFKSVSNLCDERIEDFFTKLTQKDSEQLKRLKNKTIDFDLTINNKILNDEMNAIVDDFLSEINNELFKKQIYLKEAEGKMRSLIKTFTDIISKECDFKDFNIDVPKIDQDYKRHLQVYMPVTYIGDNKVKEKLLDTIEVQSNSVNKVFNYFARNKKGDYSINSNLLKSIKMEYSQYLKKNANDEYKHSYNLLRYNLIECINNCENNINNNLRSIKTTYNNIVADILRELAESKTSIENELTDINNKLQFNNEMYKIMKNFLDQWSIIRTSVAVPRSIQP